MNNPLPLAIQDYKDYFVNFLCRKEKIFRHLFILSELMQYNPNQCNTINKQCSLDLNKTYRVKIMKSFRYFVYNLRCLYIYAQVL